MPNVVFFLADDVGFNSLGEDVTPFLTTLRAQGIGIENYYTQESSTPARASLLTGRHPLTLGLQKFEHSVVETGGLPLDETTLAEVLKDNGYATYIYGKWNLGNQSPRYLPTARGFDEFLGFLDGYNNYWSKSNPTYMNYMDFMSADKKCFNVYDSWDVNTYSTTLYRDKAVATIAGHDFRQGPMFLLMSLQAAQNPFADSNTDFPQAIPDTDVESDALSYITKKVKGVTQQEYFKSIAIMDSAIAEVHKAIVKKGVLENTYFIFASDNGGCPGAGGRNAPLRGTKGSLFDGGVRVDSFIYSPLLAEEIRGSTFFGLFHVSDWFPTVLGMAGISYDAPEGFELDGVNQLNSMQFGSTHPRASLLINYYYDPVNTASNYWHSVPVAVRNSQYKLIHTYESKTSGDWYTTSETLAVDDNMNVVVGCSMAQCWTDGQFKYFLFDMVNDPYETTNLYNRDDTMVKMQEQLYNIVANYVQKAKSPIASKVSDTAFMAFDANKYRMLPWRLPEEVTVFSSTARQEKATYPSFCGLSSAPSQEEDIDAYTAAINMVEEIENPKPLMASSGEDAVEGEEVAAAPMEAAHWGSSLSAFGFSWPGGKVDLKTAPPTPTPTMNQAEQDAIKNDKLPLPDRSSRKPNIIFMLADDLAHGAFDDELNPAPFLSELKQKSVTLNKYYSQETCTPARAALLTGRLPISVGWQKYEQSATEPGGLDLDETTIAEALQDAGYTTYMFGKWNMGNQSPRYLPTARGFDYFLGYMDSSNNYWSKKLPLEDGGNEYVDFTYADKTCYYAYDAPDRDDYSTSLYAQHAATSISSHDFDESPMFMYISFQAVHNPFADQDGDFPQGLPEDMFDASVFRDLTSKVNGVTQQQYYLAMNQMDKAAEVVYNALNDKGVLFNSYIIFASDNGGCPGAGGRNIGLRGTKGSLFEGGVKVDSFVYSPLMFPTLQGSYYDGLFHVSDWFPTILSMTGVDYTPTPGYEPDGLSQFEVMFGGSSDYPRKYLLYNYYYDPAHTHSTYENTVPVAIRNNQYKLIHTYASPIAGDWYNAVDVFKGDDDLKESAGCDQASAWEDGSFTFYLFDLENDPAETTNLYDSTDDMKAIQAELYKQIDVMVPSIVSPLEHEPSESCYVVWEFYGNYVVPWEYPEPADSLILAKQQRSYPDICGYYSKSWSPTGPKAIPEKYVPPPPTPMPSEKPSTGPSAAPSQGATYKPTYGPRQANVVFIMADDLGYNSLSQDVTPNLMAMKKGGITLGNYYTQESSTPSRAAFLTGRLPLRLGMQKYEQHVDSATGLDLAETTLAEVMKANGYSTYLFGKWNLGNASPRQLPTARGFDSFLGYMDSGGNYYSKRSVSYPDYVDFLYANAKCYYMYDVDSATEYSTNIYRIRAVDAINAHDYDASPMFMYLSFQSPSAPFSDHVAAYASEIPSSMIKTTTFNFISSTFPGKEQQEYFKALAVLDDSVAAILTALEDKGAKENTYVIFTSDNGGCPSAGGRNTPLRGMKGSLYEGGVKVDAFVYSPIIPYTLYGSSYDDMFHVSDWFPTILSMTGITYKPPTGSELDGHDMYPAMTTGAASTRTHLLINYYYDPAQPTSTHWNSVPVAIRNNQYKLVHTYEAKAAAEWYGATIMMASDDKIADAPTCTVDAATSGGEFKYYLFDLTNDPKETVNLYDSTADLQAVQKYFYAVIESYKAKAAPPLINTEGSKTCTDKWAKYKNYVVPFLDPEDASALPATKQAATYPSNCGSFAEELATLAKLMSSKAGGHR